MYTSDHDEYNESNNRAEVTIKHHTVFNQVPTNIVTALGTTLTLPITFESTSQHPDIVLTEITDGTEDWSPRMGICYYDPDRKVIVAAPNSTAQQMLANGQVPTGILQIKDQATNTIYAITYRIGSMADGVNIYRDDASFRFFDANGAPTNLTAAASENPGWRFLDWATDSGWYGGNPGEIPMNKDLTFAGQDGAFFTFDTVADTMKIYFTGELTVISSVFMSEQTFTESPAELNFHNSSGLVHTIAVIASQGTMIDRYTPTYAVNTVVDADPDAPQILWNRSFPDPASLKPGQSVNMTCYIADATGLQSVRFNDQTLTDKTTPKLVKLDDGLWYFDYRFTVNGRFSVQAFDLSGNSSTGSFAVNWFNDVLSAGAISGAPGLIRSHLSFIDASGNPISSIQTITTAPFLKSSYAPDRTERSSAYLFVDGAFSGEPLGKATGERWLASWNGYYLVRVDRDDGTWARAVTLLRNLDLTTPAVTLDLPGKGTPDSPYLIDSRADWRKLRTYVNGKNSTAGMCFLQTSDFSIKAVDMIGSSSAFFRGVYDGGGHTLTFNVEEMAAAYCAPFLYVEDASFRNMHIDGSVSTSQKFVAGICANVSGGCSFFNCRSSLVIQSSVNGDGTHGGFVAVGMEGGSMEFTGCSVDGQFLGLRTTLCGGFVGYARGPVSFRDCLLAPTAAEWGSSQNFSRGSGDASYTWINSYYLQNSLNNQGVRAYVVRPGLDVILRLVNENSYATAALDAASIGLRFGGTIYAASGETVRILPAYANKSGDRCGSFFTATAGTLTMEEEHCSLVLPSKDVTIEAAAHEWSSPEYNWAEDNNTATAMIACQHDQSHRQTETVNTNFILTKPSTFEEEGSGYYVAEFQNSPFETQIKYVVIPPVACEGGDACPSKHFTDMPAITSTMHIPIDWAVLNRITTGTSPTTFGPKNSCTRAQFVTFLWRTCGQPEPTVTTHPFKDVKSTAFYYKAMLWAVENNITAGTSATTFSPNKPCTRAQVVTFIWRLENTPEPTTTDNPFVDVKSSAYYYKAVLWAVERGITTGTSATTFGPGKDCTRGQCVTFLYREFAQ